MNRRWASFVCLCTLFPMPMLGFDRGYCNASSRLDQMFSAMSHDVDEDASKAMALMQMTLMYRLRANALNQDRSGTMAAGNASAIGNQAMSRPMPRPLYCDSEVMTFSLSALSSIQVLQHFGLIDYMPCLDFRVEHLRFSGLQMRATVQTRNPWNQLMQKLSVPSQNKVTWGCAGLLALWCIATISSYVYSVVRVPTVYDSPKPVQNIANEEAAWSSSAFTWLNMTWADEVIGRYGKCWDARVVPGEITLESSSRTHIPGKTPFDIIREAWQAELIEQGEEQASLTRAIKKLLSFKTMSVLFIMVFVEIWCGAVGTVLLLEKLLKTMMAISDAAEADPNAPISYLEPGLTIFLCVFVLPMLFRYSSIVVTLLDGYYAQIVISGMGALIFEKALTLPIGHDESSQAADSPELNTKPTAAQLLNSDILGTFLMMYKMILYLIISPFLIVTLFVMMVSRVHLAGIVGLSYCVPALIISWVVVAINMRMIAGYQGYQDVRLRTFTQAITQIRAIKSLAVEHIVFQELDGARKNELSYAQWVGIVSGIAFSIFTSIPWGCILVTLAWLLHSNGMVTAVQILIVQRLMGMLLNCIGLWNMAIHKCVSIPISFHRVRVFLCQEARPENISQMPQPGEDEPAVKLRGSFTFLKDKEPILKDLDICMGKGELVAVIGSVASGKSALMHAIVGELYTASEDAAITAPDASAGQIAYCGQVPWIIEGSLRENVTLSSPFEADRYFQALYAACLGPDLQIFPGGDQVIIGSNGIRVSGGQKARIALARAMYMKSAQVVIMDDPFASVDVSTGQHVFENLVLGPAMSSKTRIVVTQPTPARLRRFDKVLLFEGGRVVASGTPNQVMTSDAFSSFLDRHKEIAESAKNQELVPVRQPDAFRGANEIATLCREKLSEADTELREAEEFQQVSWSTCKWWLREAGYFNITFFFATILASKGLDLLQLTTMSAWIDAKEKADGGDIGNSEDWAFLENLMVKSIILVVLGIVSAYSGTRVGLATSAKLHTMIVTRLLHAPIDRFYDKQPVGRLLNRLSSDMKLADDQMPFVISMVLGTLSVFVFFQGFILTVVPLWMALSALPFFAASLFFLMVYRGATVTLIFNDRRSMSQVHDIQSVALVGHDSIRANGMADHYILNYRKLSAVCFRSGYLANVVCTAWLQSRMFLCFTCLSSLFALASLHSSAGSGTIMIIIILMNVQMSSMQMLSTILSQALGILNATQRLVRYIDLPQEPPNNMPNDPTIRLRLWIESRHLRPLEVRFVDPKVCKGTRGVFIKGRHGAPLFLIDETENVLTLLPGRRFQELAPNCSEIRELSGGVHITTVNNAWLAPTAMVDELSNPRGKVWIECWNSQYADGFSVKFQNVTAAYCLEKPVLHSISFDIPARMKVGIAGPTGCGKSTTMLCILRVLETRSGRIMVGKMDISKIGIKLLRSIVGLVPQDATIFEGTWRSNIDPFNEFPEGKIWDAVFHTHLLTYLRSFPEGLDHVITQDGANLSFGQRQQLSLARMVIRQPPVLLLDESTSALDPVTQSAVQKAVLNSFPRSTVISIAHRIETLLDFDRVIVFERGEVVENASVNECLANTNSVFAGMVSKIDH